MRTLIVISFVLLFSACGRLPVDWTPYYESQHTSPYGTKVLENELQNIFRHSDFYQITGKTEDDINSWYDTDASFIYVNPKFYPDSTFTEDLEQFTDYGNSLFIATEDETHALFSKFHLGMMHQDQDSYRLQLNYLYSGSKHYTIENRPNNAISYFTSIPSYAKVLGTVEIGDTTFPNFLYVSRRDSDNKILIHANPELFSNYHLLNHADAEYSLNTFSHLLHTQTIFWDGYGTARRYAMTEPVEGDSNSLLRYILSSQALTLGFGTLLLAFILFFLFNYKRKTRSIPIHVPQENNSLAFVELISTLFEGEENQIDLAKYRANYILDIIKEKYYVDIESLDDIFIQRLSHKTEINIETLKPFVFQLRKARNKNYMNQDDFAKFCRIIEPITHRLSS